MDTNSHTFVSTKINIIFQILQSNCVSRFKGTFVHLQTVFASTQPFSDLTVNIRSSEKFLSFDEKIMRAQHFSFYIILSNYVRSSLFYQNKNHNVRQIRFHVCIKVRRCKRRVCKRKTLFGQLSTYWQLSDCGFCHYHLMTKSAIT